MAKKAKLPIEYAPASNSLAARVRVTSGDEVQVISQVEFKAFKAVADALKIPLKPAKSE